MKMVKDKQILVGADFAGFPLKEQTFHHKSPSRIFCLLRYILERAVPAAAAKVFGNTDPC